MRTTASCPSDTVWAAFLPSATFLVGDWLVEPELNRVSRDGMSAHVRPQLMDLLVYLARNSGRTVPHHELLANLWPGQPFIASTALPRCIAELRQTLGDRAAGSTVIQTVPKRGYRLIAVVGSAVEPTLAEKNARRPLPMQFGSGERAPDGLPLAPKDVPAEAGAPPAGAGASPAGDGAGGSPGRWLRAISWLQRARQLVARAPRSLRFRA
jgi:DNA-binding winged helix-turn-helix (wHTH) protein